MSPGIRRLALTAHVTAAVGWLGAVCVFLALAIIAITSTDAQTVRGVYLVMEPAAWFALVPFAVASLLTGLVQSLGTPWGLIRHYWVLVKLALTVLATIVLLVYMQTFNRMADAAGDPSTSINDLRTMGYSPSLHASLALVLLLTATVLAVYKPRGMTRYGQRKQGVRRP